VKFETPTRRALALILAASFAAFAGAYAADKKDKKDKPAPNPIVDSGSFGVFIRGQRVATETFHIEQQGGESIVKSQLKETAGSDSGSQKSELTMTSSGELLRYEWSQSSGASLVVAPDNDFLKEKISASPGAKAAEQAFLLPSGTPILDNNFFVHREILAWKYLNGICQAGGGDTKCRQEAADFGVLVPQDHTSLSIRMELIGRAKITIRGAERELMHVNLTGEDLQWELWLDENDHFKLIRVAIPADSTVVDRD